MSDLVYEHPGTQKHTRTQGPPDPAQSGALGPMNVNCQHVSLCRIQAGICPACGSGVDTTGRGSGCTD